MNVKPVNSLAQTVAVRILKVSYSKRADFKGAHIEVLSALHDIIAHENDSSYKPLEHWIFCPPKHKIPAPKGVYRTVYKNLSYINEAPTLKDIEKQCHSIQVDVEAVGRLCRYLLLLHRTAPGKTAVGMACEMQTATIGDHNDLRSSKRLQGLWSKYRTAAPSCFALFKLKAQLIDFWQGSVSDTLAKSALSITKAARSSLADIAPLKGKKIVDPDSGYAESHLGVNEMGENWPRQVEERHGITVLDLSPCLNDVSEKERDYLEVHC